MTDRIVGRCIGCFHPFEYGPCGGCGAVAECPKHSVGMEWHKGDPVPGYDPRMRPVGWVCPADPGHSTAPESTAVCAVPPRTENDQTPASAPQNAHSNQEQP